MDSIFISNTSDVSKCKPLVMPLIGTVIFEKKSTDYYYKVVKELFKR
jgi:hypothetical protein